VRCSLDVRIRDDEKMYHVILDFAKKISKKIRLNQRFFFECASACQGVSGRIREKEKIAAINLFRSSSNRPGHQEREEECVSTHKPTRLCHRRRHPARCRVLPA